MIAKRLVALGLFLLAAPLLAQETAPTIDPATFLPMPELRKYYDDKQYLLVSQQIGKIQGNKRILEQYNLFDLLVLKAESLFRTGRYNQGAIDAMNQAAKENKDNAKSAECYATALLFKRSIAGLKYQPKTKDPAAAGSLTGQPTALAPIDLTDMAQRKAALQALYLDERTAADAIVKPASLGTSLLPIANAAKSLVDLRTLELAATNSTLKTEAVSHDLAAHAATLMTSAIDKGASQVTALERTANILDTYSQPILDPTTGKVIGQQPMQRKRGLSRGDLDDLTAIARDADRIVVAIKELTDMLHVAGTEFTAVTPKATKLAADARSVANADYSGTTNLPRR